jgi:5-methylthioadenosine/S-adenosylhomocysteine deaminase
MRGFLLPTLYNKQMKKQVDLIINARWILPVVPSHSLLQNYTVVVLDGKVIDICALSIANDHYQTSEYIDLDDHVLIPGFINLHTHAAMNLMRGLADDVPLMPWLQEHIWPAEAKLISPAFVHDGTLLACAEMLSGGITCFNDMYFYPESAAEASIKAGLRANLGLVVLEFPTQYALDADSYIQQGLNARDHLREASLIQFSLAPHAPYTVSDSTFNRIAMLAEQVNIGVHTHLHETQEEIAQSEQIHGLRPLKRLANLGLLGPNLTLAHCVYLDEAEIKLLAENGCNIAHCPSSNLKLASGIAPINTYLKQGVNIGLGTDGAASNNRLDMFTEMRLAALLAKGQSGDATAISAHQVLEMATINGAKAMNLQDKIGSIEIGKRADFSAVRMSEFEMHPCFDVVSHLVYVAGREQVSHVWVDGDLKYHKPENSRGIFSNIEPQELTDIISKWQPKVSEFR